MCNRRFRFAAIGILGFAICVSTLAGDAVNPAETPVAAEQMPKFSPEEVRALVAPVALYPDVILAQVLPASTFPIQIVEASRYAETAADPKTPPANARWDSSVVALLNYPMVLKKLNDDLAWLEKLGTVVTYQMGDVTQAIQKLRAEAQTSGHLNSNDKQNVNTDGQVTRIVPTNPNVVYVPNYDYETVYAPDSVGYQAPIYYSVGYPVFPWCDNDMDWLNHRVWGRHVWNGGNWHSVGDRFVWHSHPQGVAQWHPARGGANTNGVKTNTTPIAVTHPAAPTNFVTVGNRTRSWSNSETGNQVRANTTEIARVDSNHPTLHAQSATRPHALNSAPKTFNYPPQSHFPTTAYSGSSHHSSVYNLRTYPSGGYYHGYSSSGFSHGRTSHRR